VSNLLSETIAVLALISRPFPLRNVTCVELMFWSVTWWVQTPRNDNNSSGWSLLKRAVYTYIYFPRRHSTNKI
jgi:hypothetical protein